jgi:hypothetical protein
VSTGKHRVPRERDMGVVPFYVANLAETWGKLKHNCESQARDSDEGSSSAVFTGK